MMGIGKKTVAAMLCATLGASAAQAESFGFHLVYEVPVMCSVTSAAGGGGATASGSFELGSLHEYCNAPGGYDLRVNYTPGTLRGMTLIAGEDRVVLDGSGTVMLSGAAGPSIKNRNLEAIPGPLGFDADHLDFEAVAKAL